MVDKLARHVTLYAILVLFRLYYILIALVVL